MLLLLILKFILAAADVVGVEVVVHADIADVIAAVAVASVPAVDVNAAAYVVVALVAVADIAFVDVVPCVDAAVVANPGDVILVEMFVKMQSPRG